MWDLSHYGKEAKNMNKNMNNEEILTENPSENKQEESGVKYIALKDGLHVVRTACNAGTLHLYVRDGKLQDITLFNAKISKKKTHTSIHGHHVNLDVKLDWEDVRGLGVDA